VQISTETVGNVLVAHTPDELTEDTAAAFFSALDAPVTSGQVRIVLQMDRSEIYDSSGLSALLDFQDRLKRAGGNVKISGLADHSRKIFEVTRLDQRVDVFGSVIDAVASFN
jgi:anti-anti-sigma factor